MSHKYKRLPAVLPRTGTAQEAHQIWLDTPVFAPRSRGPSLAPGKCLKRLGKDFDDLDMDRDFGVYLGQHGHEHLVAIKHPDDCAGLGPLGGYPFTGLEAFADLGDLASQWEMD